MMEITDGSQSPLLLCCYFVTLFVNVGVIKKSDNSSDKAILIIQSPAC